MGSHMTEDRTINAVLDEDEKHIAAIKHSIKNGQNHIDSAQIYGSGYTDELVGKAIAGEDRNQLYIATKFWKTHASELGVENYVNRALELYRTDHLDLLYVHAPWDRYDMADYAKGMMSCIDKGLVKELGVSNFNIDQIKEIQKHLGVKLVANQNHYNILNHNEVSQDLLNHCKDEEIMIVAYRPVERKLLADNCDNEIVLEMAKKYEATPAQIALRWLIQQENTVAIPKSSTIEHLDENLGAMKFEISSQDMVKLSNI